MYTIDELEVVFYEELNDLSQNYGSYTDLVRKNTD